MAEHKIYYYFRSDRSRVFTLAMNVSVRVSVKLVRDFITLQQYITDPATILEICTEEGVVLRDFDMISTESRLVLRRLPVPSFEKATLEAQRGMINALFRKLSQMNSNDARGGQAHANLLTEANMEAIRVQIENAGSLDEGTKGVSALTDGFFRFLLNSVLSSSGFSYAELVRTFRRDDAIDSGADGKQANRVVGGANKNAGNRRDQEYEEDAEDNGTQGAAVVNQQYRAAAALRGVPGRARAFVQVMAGVHPFQPPAPGPAGLAAAPEPDDPSLPAGAPYTLSLLTRSPWAPAGSSLRGARAVSAPSGGQAGPAGQAAQGRAPGQPGQRAAAGTPGAGGAGDVGPGGASAGAPAGAPAGSPAPAPAGAPADAPANTPPPAPTALRTAEAVSLLAMAYFGLRPRAPQQPPAQAPRPLGPQRGGARGPSAGQPPRRGSGPAQGRRQTGPSRPGREPDRRGPPGRSQSGGGRGERGERGERGDRERGDRDRGERGPPPRGRGASAGPGGPANVGPGSGGGPGAAQSPSSSGVLIIGAGGPFRGGGDRGRGGRGGSGRGRGGRR